jgi:hypothetical protein
MSDSSPPPPGYASDPTLEMLWGPPPAYTGDLGDNAAGSASTPLAIIDQPVSVDLAAMQAAEQSLLDVASTLVNAYNPLNQQVQADNSAGTIFGQQDTFSLNILTGTGLQIQSTEPEPEVQQSAQQFAALMNPVMTRALRMVADATETIGVFIAMLDKAGQAYAAADQNSMFPPPPPVTPVN